MQTDIARGRATETQHLISSKVVLTISSQYLVKYSVSFGSQWRIAAFGYRVIMCEFTKTHHFKR